MHDKKTKRGHKWAVSPNQHLNSAAANENGTSKTAVRRNLTGVAKRPDFECFI